MCTRLLSEEHTAGRDCMIFAGGTPGLREDKFSQPSMGARLETGGLSRGEMMVAPLVSGLVAAATGEVIGFQMYLQAELMVFADDLNVGKA